MHDISLGLSYVVQNNKNKKISIYYGRKIECQKTWYCAPNLAVLKLSWDWVKELGRSIHWEKREWVEKMSH